MSTPQKSNASGGRWQYSAKNEARKLGNNEGDWNLAGATLTRTRLGRRKSKKGGDDDTVDESSKETRPSSPKELVIGAGDKANDDAQSTALSSLTGDSSSQSKNRPSCTC